MIRFLLRLRVEDLARLRLSSRQKRRLRVAVRRQLYLDVRRLVWLAVLGVGIAVVVILAQAGSSDRRGAEAFEAADPPVTEEEARELAFSEAETRGFVPEPEAWLARRISFGEYATLAGERTIAFFGTPDLAPSAIVWVVSIRGELNAPVLGGEALSFDNLTVLLDAADGETLHVASFFEQYESGVRLPGFFTRSLPCEAEDLGVFEEIFRSTCPYPVPAEAPAGEEIAEGAE